MRVVDLSRLFPGPYCSRILVDLGAEVIRVERPTGGGWVRQTPPLEPDSGESLLFRALNRGKKSLTLDLKSVSGREIFLRLVADADVLLESFRPEVMQRLDLDYEALAELNPRLVYCSLSGYGEHGPYRNRAGHDLNFVGLSGLLDLTGPRDGAPAISGAPLADLSGALWAAVGILAALLERQTTGVGQRVSGSLLGGALSFLPLAVACQKGGQPLARGASELTGGLVCYHLYETKDGGYMNVAALEPRFWGAFCDAVNREHLKAQQYAAATPGEPVYEEVRALFQSRTREEWIVLLESVEACCEPVYSVAEALASPPVQALDMITAHGLHPPIGLSGHPWAPVSPAPALGQHTMDILSQLGYSADQISVFQEQSIV